MDTSMNFHIDTASGMEYNTVTDTILIIITIPEENPNILTDTKCFSDTNT